MQTKSNKQTSNINSLRRQNTKIKNELRVSMIQVAEKDDQIQRLKREMRVLKYELNKIKTQVVEHKGKMFSVSGIESEFFGSFGIIK